METLYFETTRFICHEGNVVDFAAYQQGLKAVSGEAFPQGTPTSSELIQPAPILALVPEQEQEVTVERTPRREHVSKLSLYLDVCASGMVLLLGIAALVQFFRLI